MLCESDKEEIRNLEDGQSFNNDDCEIWFKHGFYFLFEPKYPRALYVDVYRSQYIEDLFKQVNSWT